MEVISVIVREKNVKGMVSVVNVLNIIKGLKTYHCPIAKGRDLIYPTSYLIRTIVIINDLFCGQWGL